jgi:hypothetical protein
MEQRRHQKQILADLVDAGRITPKEADDIARAPEWLLGIRELVSYLAAIIIGAGVLRIVAVLVEDASTTAIAAALYIIAAVLAAGSWKLSSGSAVRQRLAEVLELAAVLAAVVASGLLLADTDVDEQGLVAALSGAVLLWGAWRAPRSRFVGSLLATGAMPTFVTSLIGVIREDSPNTGGIAMLVGGAGLLALGSLRGVGISFVPRAFGSLYVVIGAMMIGGVNEGAWWLVTLALGVAMFALGSLWLAPEMLLAGAILVVGPVVALSLYWIGNEVLQGVVIIAVGVGMLAVLGVQMRRAVAKGGTPVT